MIVNPNLIQPSQDFLKPGTIKFILRCIDRGELEKLPPTPIVREWSDNKLIAIDGHNLIAVKLHLGQEIEVHVAKSADNGLLPNSDANIERNKDLKTKFESVIEDRLRLEGEGINSFNDLLERYQYLFD